MLWPTIFITLSSNNRQQPRHRIGEEGVIVTKRKLPRHWLSSAQQLLVDQSGKPRRIVIGEQVLVDAKALGGFVGSSAGIDQSPVHPLERLPHRIAMAGTVGGGVV